MPASFRFFAISALSVTILAWQNVQAFFSALPYSGLAWVAVVQTRNPVIKNAAGSTSFNARIVISLFGPNVSGISIS